jgi:hypothetical protein
MLGMSSETVARAAATADVTDIARASRSREVVAERAPLARLVEIERHVIRLARHAQLTAAIANQLRGTEGR